MKHPLTFCATGKTGLGHLRRVTNIAAALQQQDPALPLALVTNAATEGLAIEEVALYGEISQIARPEMTRHLSDHNAHAVVVDTAVLADLHRLRGPLCLILRETKPDKQHRFALQQGRPWDLLIVPNPPDHWLPDPEQVPARRTEAVGWIFRRPPDSTPAEPADAATPADLPPMHTNGEERQVLIASGGGGADFADFNRLVGAFIQSLQRRLQVPISVSQVLGPRVAGEARLAGVDHTVHPGAELHRLFPQADLVISTVGYNSTLELACTDVPTLLVPIDRTYDDQHQRACHWQPRLGGPLLSQAPEAALDWAAAILTSRDRRPPVELGSSGAEPAASLLRDLVE